MDKKKIREYLRLAGALFFSWIYFPHIVCCILKKKRKLIISDLMQLKMRLNICIPTWIAFLYFIHNNDYYRSLYYHRIGPALSLLIGWYRPGSKYLIISKTTLIGENVYLAHPYSTIINAESIGKNFSFRHLTTIGNKSDKDSKRPIIGDNVTLGANVNIIGNIRIGNNVIIGAGSVVVKDVPDNCVVAGNPAIIIRYIK